MDDSDKDIDEITAAVEEALHTPGGHKVAIIAAVGLAVILSKDVRRIAMALETIAKRADDVTDYFDADKAQVRVGANCDVRQVG